VTFEGTNRVAWLDLEDRGQPRVSSRSDLPEGPPLLMDAPGGPWVVPTPDRDALVADVGTGATRLVIQASPQGAGLEIISGETHLFPLRGRLNLSAQRPTGLAFDRDRGLLAVANRSGGVHLIAVGPQAGEGRPRGDIAVSGRGRDRR
jgi:glycerol-3-phosphate acyltransferase PlsY